MQVDTDELCAPSDIADMLSVKPSAVTNWTTRDVGFPAPVAHVARGSQALYLRSQVIEWYAKRLPPGRLEAMKKIIEALERKQDG